MRSRGRWLLPSAAAVAVACANPPANLAPEPASDAAHFEPEPDVCSGPTPPSLQVRVTDGAGAPWCDATVTVRSGSSAIVLPAGAPPACVHVGAHLPPGSARVEVTRGTCVSDRDVFLESAGCPAYPRTVALVVPLDCDRTSPAPSDASMSDGSAAD